MRRLLSQVGSEFYRRFMSNLEGAQSIRTVDTGEIIPKLERGHMYTYQMRVYNISNSTSISNARAKLHLRTESLQGHRVEFQTELCWGPNKGTVTINRGDHEWLNIATVRHPKEEGFKREKPVAELLFPTEAGVLNPSTIEFYNRATGREEANKEESTTRQSLPIYPQDSYFGERNIRISSTNRPISFYDLSISHIDNSIRLSVDTHRHKLSQRVAKWLFNLSDRGIGAGVDTRDLAE